jgi:hypothetical protein
MIVGGLGMVVVAARVLVPAASEIAVRIGVPDDVIAATMVALGTSLPELTTAIAAVRKGYPQITLGNVVGADVLNCLFVIGAAATARPLAIPPNFFYFHFPAMLLDSLLDAPVHRLQPRRPLPPLARRVAPRHLRHLRGAAIHPGCRHHPCRALNATHRHYLYFIDWVIIVMESGRMGAIGRTTMRKSGVIAPGKDNP